MMCTFDVKAYSISSFEEFCKEANVAELPNILEVLDYFAEEELKNKLDPLQSSYLSNLQCEGKFHKLRDNDTGFFSLRPASPSGNTLYRGQSKYRNPCSPSIYRESSSTVELQERLKYCELAILLETHPIVRDFLHAGITVSIEGLAQHYGLKTNMLDVTSNKWTAAFFACTHYSDDTYKLLDNNYENVMGVIYRLDVNPDDFKRDISVIGAQPFERPTRQNAYGVKLAENQNFNDRENLKVIPFRHDPRAESILFDMYYKSKRLFPDDMLVSVVDEISKTKEISMPAVFFCKDKYYSDITDEELSKQIAEIGVTIVPECKITFPEDELHQQCDYWWKYGREKLSRNIKEIWFTSFPLIFEEN